MLAIKSVNVVSHFTDWTVGHVHSGALGWNALITFGTFYYLVPRLVGGELYSRRLANVHFWMALAGTMLYILSMWAAGVSQGLLWLTLDEIGELQVQLQGHHGEYAALLPVAVCRRIRVPRRRGAARVEPVHDAKGTPARGRKAADG